MHKLPPLPIPVAANLSRRHIIIGAAAALVSPLASGGLAAHANFGGSADGWEAWRSRFVMADGRVTDTGNGGISHSEGQSYGMLFAEANGDRATFDLIHHWAVAHLLVRGDSLMAWRWKPNTNFPVDDINNATDADLITCWALLRASRRWSDAGLATSARRIAFDIERLLVLRTSQRTLLLPGAVGFVHRGTVTINPSYYSFAALRALAEAYPQGPWKDVFGSGLTLLREAQFGQWHLPPDWAAVEPNGRVTLALDKPHRFSYDAIRVPLHLAWAGLAREPGLTASVAFWAAYGRSPPASTDLVTGAILEPRASRGFAAVSSVAAAAAVGRRSQATEILTPMPQDDYYSASLCMLARMAAVEMPQVDQTIHS